MKALVILYDGSEIQSYVLDQMIAAMANDPQRKIAEAYRLSDDDMARAAALHVLPSQTLIGKDTPDQIAINHAVEYITQAVLVYSTNPVKVGYMIGSAIANGSSEMYNAVEIIATKNGVIHEPKLTKSIVTAIKQLYEAFKCV